MAFIKRSTITPVNAKVGSKMLKCTSCGKPLVSKISISMCQNCISKTSSTSENSESDCCSESDLDQE